MSHSSRDNRQAVAIKQWLIEQEPGLADEIFLDLDPHTGIRPGERWRQTLQQANARCEAVICLLSKNWEASRECQTEFRYAENLSKTILCARLEPVSDTNITSEWQRCDLFPDHGPPTEVDIGDEVTELVRGGVETWMIELGRPRRGGTCRFARHRALNWACCFFVRGFFRRGCSFGWPAVAAERTAPLVLDRPVGQHVELGDLEEVVEAVVFSWHSTQLDPS